MRDDTEQLMRDSLKLKVHINSGEKPDFECQIYNHLPNQEEHKDHILEEPIDQQLIDRIQQMKRHHKQFVKRDIFAGQTSPPLLTNGHF